MDEFNPPQIVYVWFERCFRSGNLDRRTTETVQGTNRLWTKRDEGASGIRYSRSWRSCGGLIDLAAALICWNLCHWVRCYFDDLRGQKWGVDALLIFFGDQCEFSSYRTYTVVLTLLHSLSYYFGYIYQGDNKFISLFIQSSTHRKRWSNQRRRRKNAASAWMRSQIRWHCLAVINFALSAWMGGGQNTVVIEESSEVDCWKRNWIESVPCAEERSPRPGRW